MNKCRILFKFVWPHMCVHNILLLVAFSLTCFSLRTGPSTPFMWQNEFQFAILNSGRDHSIIGKSGNRRSYLTLQSPRAPDAQCSDRTRCTRKVSLKNSQDATKCTDFPAIDCFIKVVFRGVHTINPIYLRTLHWLGLQKTIYETMLVAQPYPCVV